MKNIKYARIYFRDHIREYPNRVEIKDIGEGLSNLIPKPGQIIEQGTAHSANIMNRLDIGIYDAHLDIFNLSKELERIRVQLELDGRVPNSNGAFFDILDGSDSRNIKLDTTKGELVGEVIASTLVLPVSSVEGFVKFTEVTIVDDVNMEDVTITAIDEELKTITVNKLLNNYKKGAVVARSTININTELKEMDIETWGIFDIMEVF